MIVKNMHRDTQDAIFDIIQALRLNNSKLYKKEILRENYDFQPWLDYLVEVYNPFILYGKTGYKNGDQDDLENLKLCRSINAGVTAVTINKIYKNLIPTASKMNKAYDFGKKPKALDFPLWAAIKYDGNYVNIAVNDEGTKFFTSGGHEYTHDIELDLSPGFVYMAERIAGEGKLGDRRRCSLEGGVGAKYAKLENSYRIFDCVTLSDFHTGLAVAGYEDRRNFLPNENRADERKFTTMEDLEEWLNALVDIGYEGIVMKDPGWKWKDTKSRTAKFYKWKKRQTADLYCIEELEGEGNSQGIIGSIKLRDSMGRIVSVGSGLSLNGDLPFGSYVGNVVEIEYEHIADTYIQPTVVGIRHDKQKEDID